MNRVFGLIGFPLGHSFSTTYFIEKFKREKIPDVSYLNFPIQNIRDFPTLLISEPLPSGFNVTIPYKETILPFLNQLDETAKKVGAVNCIRVQRNQDKTVETIGYNTDVIGFEFSLKNFIPDYKGKALVIGTGGSSKAVQFVLGKLGIPFLVVSRNPEHGEFSYKELFRSVLENHHLIINCTPLGMWPNEETCPYIHYEFLTSKHFLFDLVYNPEETTFLKKGKENGAKTKNGKEMLLTQAEASWEIWNSQ